MQGRFALPLCNYVQCKALTIRHFQQQSPQAGTFSPLPGSCATTQADPIFSSFIAQGALQNLIFAQPPAAGYKVSDLVFSKATLDLVKPRHA